MVKKILLFLLAAFVVIQFIHPKPNKSKGDQPNAIGKKFQIPEDAKNVLAKACNDCHTNNTKYPWYSNIQPVDWWMNGHVKNGKKSMNMDEYTNKSLRYQYHKMEEIIDMVKESKMPLNSYTWMHKNAKLSQDEKNSLINWANSVMDTMKANYPIDSLIRKK